MNTHFFNLQLYSPNPTSMAFSAVGLRLFRCYNHRQGRSPTISKLRPLSDLHFFSTSTPRRPTIQAKRKKEREVRAVNGEDGNGSLSLKDRDSSNERIVPTELHKEATEAYMAYAMSVLLGRALPDVRDGLKPVHRRVLWVIFSNY